MQWTNRGKISMMKRFLRQDALPANYHAALCTAATTPTATTNTMSQLTQIAVGNGYADGGLALTKDNVDFPNSAEDDTLNLGAVDIKNLVWNAQGGPLPASGAGARWGVLTDAATPVSSREVIGFADLQSVRSVVQNQPLELRTWKIRLKFNRGVTNRACLRMLQWMFSQETTTPTQFNLALVTDANPPTDDTNTFSQLTEIALGNGYASAGGIAIQRNTTDFPTARDQEDDTGHVGKMGIRLIEYTAAGGPLPSDSVGARYAVLLDNNATPGSREVLMWWDLNSPVVVSDGEKIALDPLNISFIE